VSILNAVLPRELAVCAIPSCRGCFILHESDFSHGGTPAYGNIVLVRQPDFETAWWTEHRWDDFPRHFFVVGTHACQRT
jgi:hypothetical protein